MMMFTDFYVAPEVLDDKIRILNKYAYKIDIWSLGVILFELCTFERLYKVASKKDKKSKEDKLYLKPIYNNKDRNKMLKTRVEKFKFIELV